MNSARRNLTVWLVVGDILAALVVTMVGFLTHYSTLQGARWLTTFVPVLVGWFAIAPWLGVYRPGARDSWRGLWRPALAAFLSAPLAAWLRGVMLNSAILPVFVLVIGLTDAFGFLVWRAVWVLLEKRVPRHG